MTNSEFISTLYNIHQLAGSEDEEQEDLQDKDLTPQEYDRMLFEKDLQDERCE